MPRKSKKSLASDHTGSTDEAIPTLSGASDTQSPGTDQDVIAEKAIVVLSAPGDAIILITRNYRDRRFAMEQRKRADLALGAYLRSALGWRKDLPDAERKAIAAEAARIAKNPEGTRWESMVGACVKSREPFEAIESAALKEMERIAKTFPVWSEFGKDIRGFGAASLAVIIAEAGDLSNYADKGKLWKRLGLAVIGDVRQGNPGKGASADDWIAHGYNPSRRSAIWNIGDTMLKAQIRKVKDSAGEDTGERTALGVYGEAYLARKAYEIARNPEMTPMQVHRRAQRYMEKRLLKHLWQAWRRTISRASTKTNAELSDAPIQIAA